MEKSRCFQEQRKYIRKGVTNKVVSLSHMVANSLTQGQEKAKEDHKIVKMLCS